MSFIIPFFQATLVALVLGVFFFAPFFLAMVPGLVVEGLAWLFHRLRGNR